MISLGFSLFTFMHWRRKWQPTPVFLPRESQGRGSLVGCRLWGRTELDVTDDWHDVRVFNIHLKLFILPSNNLLEQLKIIKMWFICLTVIIAFLLIFFIKKKCKFLSVFILIEELPLTFLTCLMVMITLIFCFSEKNDLLFSFFETIFPV